MGHHTEMRISMKRKKLLCIVTVIGLTLSSIIGCASGSGEASNESAGGGDSTSEEAAESADAGDTAAKEESDAQNEGAVLNIYCRTDEFRHRMQDYYPGYEVIDDNTGMIGFVEVHWTMISEEADYLDTLDAALSGTADGSADASESVDLFLVEEDYVKKYVEGDYALDVEKEIGLTSEQLDDQYNYTKEIATDQNGNLRAVSWQATPGLFAYRRSIALEVLGTDDPAEVGEAISDWEKFADVAAQAGRRGYYMLSGYNDAFRVYSDNVTSSWISEEGISVDDHLDEWADMMISFTNNRYHNKTTLWSDEWYADQTSEGKVFGFFYPTWGIHYTLQVTAVDQETTQEESEQASIIGDYAVCEAPEAYHWGGIWLVGARGTDNPSLVKDIMETFTCSREVMMTITKDIKEFTNTKSGMEELAGDDDTFAQDFLAGQNPMSYFCSVAERISQRYVTEYDADLNEGFQVAMDDVMEGKSQKSAALEYFTTVALQRYPELDPNNESEEDSEDESDPE